MRDENPQCSLTNEDPFIKYLGINKIESMLKMPNCPFVLYVGNKKLVKRREFEEYIRSAISI